MRFRAEDKVAHAHQWWKEGDHPEDTVKDGVPKGTFVKKFGGTKARPESQIHDACGASWGAHGRITGVREPVCPGAWVVETKDGSTAVYMPNIFGLSYEPQDTDWRDLPVDFVADCREHKTVKKFGSVTEAATYAHGHQADTNHVSDVYMVERGEAKATKRAPRAKKVAAKKPALVAQDMGSTQVHTVNEEDTDD